jgi:Secretion system C-terminal sorting domain
MKNFFSAPTKSIAQQVSTAILTVLMIAAIMPTSQATNSTQSTQILSSAFTGCNLPAISNLRVTNKASASFTMGWNAVNGSAGYYFQIFKLNPDGTTPSTPTQKQLVLGTTSANFTRLLPGTYRLVAAAVCEEDIRNLQLRNTPPTGDPTVTNIVIDDIMWLRTQPTAPNQTNIQYTVLKDAPVSLGVFDITGREVLSVYNAKSMSEGVYDQTINMEGLQTGLYIVRLQVGKQVEVNKILKM